MCIHAIAPSHSDIPQYDSIGVTILQNFSIRDSTEERFGKIFTTKANVSVNQYFRRDSRFFFLEVSRP